MDYNPPIFTNGHQQQQPVPPNGNGSGPMYPLHPVNDDDSNSDDDAGPSDSHAHDSGTNDTPSGKKSQPKAQASFLTKLYDLLEQPEYQSMIRWDHTGEHIIVERPEMLALHVLPSVYRQSRFASFTRQLNIYGFFRKANLRNLNPGIEDPDASTWSHPTLRRSSRGTEAVTNFKRRVQDRKPKGRKKQPMGGPGMGGMGQPNFNPHMGHSQYPTHPSQSRPSTGGIPGPPPPPGMSPHHQQHPQQQHQQMQRQRALTQPSLHVNTRPMSSHGGPISAGPQTYGGAQPSWGGAYPQQSQGMHGQYPSAGYSSNSSHTTSPAEEANSHYQAYNPQSASTFGLPTVYPGPSYPSAPEPQTNPAAWPSFNNAGPPPGPQQQQQQQQAPPQQNGPSSLSSLLNPAGYSRPNTAAGPGAAPAPPSISISTSSAANSFASSSPYTASISHSPTASRPTTAYSAASSMPSVQYGGEMDGQSGGGPQSAQGGGQYDYRPRSAHSAQAPQQQQQQGPQSAHPLSQAHIPSRPSTGVAAPSPTARARGQPQTPVQGQQYGSSYPLRPMTAPDVNGKSGSLMGLPLDGYGPSASPTSADFAHSVPPGPGDPNQQQQVRPSTSHSSLSSASAGRSGAGVTPTPGQPMGMGMGGMVGVESHDYAGEHAS